MLTPPCSRGLGLRLDLTGSNCWTPDSRAWTGLNDVPFFPAGRSWLSVRLPESEVIENKGRVVHNALHRLKEEQANAGDEARNRRENRDNQYDIITLSIISLALVLFVPFLFQLLSKLKLILLLLPPTTQKSTIRILIKNTSWRPQCAG